MTSTFTPYVQGSHSARRKAAAARALLAANPVGTEVVYLVRAKSEQPNVSAVISQLTKTAEAKKLNVRHTTRIEGDLVYGILYRVPTPAPVANPARVTVTPAPAASPAAGNTVASTHLTVSHVGAAGVAEAIRRELARTHPVQEETPAQAAVAAVKRRRVDYDRLLNSAVAFLAGKPTHRVKTVSTRLFEYSTNASRRSTQMKQSSVAQKLNLRAAKQNLPVRFVTKTTKSGVRIDAVRTA